MTRLAKDIAMAPTEASMLSSYLLNAASLPTIISLEEFQNIFPKHQRAHPSIKILYKDLQFLRSVDIDVVQENVSRETFTGEQQKLSMYQGLHGGRLEKMEGVEQHQEDIDVHLFGPSGNLPTTSPMHDKKSLIREMEKACDEFETQLHQTQSAVEQSLEELREMTGGLSDLRYGSFSKVPGSVNNLAEEVIVSLKELESSCQQKLQS